MILSKLGIKTSNDKILASLSFVLFMPLLFDFIVGFSVGPTSTITMLIYGVSFIVIFVIGRHRIRIRNIVPLLFIYFLCLINILLFPDSKQYFGITQYLILFYFLPLGFVIFRTIYSWDNFLSILFVFTPIAIIMGVSVLLFTSITKLDDSITYMEFSYALLPFVCASYAYFFSKRRVVGLVLYLIGLVEMLSFGCRGAVISALVFAVFLTIINSKLNKWGLILLSIVVIVIAFNIDTLVYFLSESAYFEDSYILNRVINDSVFEVGTRELIYSNCERRLSSMGMEISGLFGDRPYCGSVYPHNIVYEILMQWGWFLGVFLLLYFAFLFIKGLVHNSTSRFVTLFFVCAVLLRFFVSGSYLNSGLFWLMIACVQSVERTNTTKVQTKN